MEVKGSTYSPGDLIPNGERLKATLYQCTRLGVCSDDVDSHMLECGERELNGYRNGYFPMPASIQTYPSYIAQAFHQDTATAPGGDIGPRIGRSISVVGIHLSFAIRDESTTGTEVIESPPGTYLGTNTPPAVDYFRFLVIVEARSTDATTNCDRAFFGSINAPFVQDQVDCTREGKYAVLFDRKIPIVPQMGVIENYFIDCDFVVEMPDGDPALPTRNKIWFCYWANTRSISTKRSHRIVSTIYYYL